MKDKELSLLSLSKITTNEILIEEQIGRLEAVRFQNFKKYLTSKEALRRKFIMSKIFGSVIFGILPIIPLLTYFQVLDFINEATYPIELILFAGSLLFGIFFLFQFFNFFIMAMLNNMKILSGDIFKWFETLPVPREKLKKLILLTIIRSLDIPLIVITISFPVIMFIGTQNILIFLASIVVSILETIFSFSLLILFAERLNRVINVNKIGSKRTHIIRLINLASYIIIVSGSVFLIQWALSSIDTFFILFFRSFSPTLIIMILSMIPFPIAPGYFLSSFIAPNRIPGFIWYNILIGFTLFLILTYLIYYKSTKNVQKTTYSKLKVDYHLDTIDAKDMVKIKIKPPIQAHIHKDLLIASRNLNTFLSLIMPIVIGFIFTFTYYSTNIGGTTPFQFNFVLNMFVILGFNIFISGMIVNGLLSMEESGSGILASLPLIPREQAYAKLTLMFLIQTISVLAPSLMYLGTNVFFISLLTALWALPFVLVLLFIMFELRIYLFGRSVHFFVIEEILPEKRIRKWLGIFSIEYFIYFVIVNITSTVYVFGGVELLFLVVIFFTLTGFILCFLVFKNIFLSSRGVKAKIPIEGVSTWFTEHSLITTLMLVIFNVFFSFLVYLIPIPSFPFLVIDRFSYEMYKFIYLIAYNFIYILLWVLIAPRILGIPYGKLRLKQYLKKITIPREKRQLNNIARNLISATIFIFINFFIITFIYIYPTGIPPPEIVGNYFLYISIYSFCFYFWQVFLFIGIIFPLILSRFDFRKAIILTALIYSILSPRFFYIFQGGYFFGNISQIIIDWMYLFLPGLLATYVYMKKKNLFITVAIIMSFDFLLKIIIEHLILISILST